MSPAPRLSVIVEWTNARQKGELRARRMLAALERQWREIAAGELRADLPAAASRFVAGLEPRAELVLVSGDAAGFGLDEQLEKRLAQNFDITLRVAEGLDYYPLKNLGAGLCSGDLLLFVDSDVVPEDGWLAHLLGTLADPEIDVACGQTYVEITGVIARAFALGWIFPLCEDSTALVPPRKVFTNNLLFRKEIFARTGFRSIGLRTRGAGSLLRQDLERLGVPIWENQAARVTHSPPSSPTNMVVRALAHGRDYYLKDMDSAGRTAEGLVRSLRVAARRLKRGFVQTFAERHRVGLRGHEVPAALGILVAYYALFALGGILTHIHPRAMTSRFRI